MFNLKNLFAPTPAATPPTPPTEVPAPTGQKEIPYDTEKEIQLRDAKTGEFIYRRLLSKEHLKMINDVFMKNAQLGQQFLNISRQDVAVVKKKLEISDLIDKSEKEVNDVINKIRDDKKLDKRWGWNMQLQCLERRDPPDA